MVKWVTLLSEHFQTEMSDLGFETYLLGLARLTPVEVQAACQRCLAECHYMPRVADILDRVPERESLPDPNLDFGPDAQEWFEDVGEIR